MRGDGRRAGAAGICWHRQVGAIWDPATGQELRRLEGHTDIVNGVRAVTVGGPELLASASLGPHSWLWNLDAGLCLVSIPVHHLAIAVVQISDLIVIGHSGGLLGIDVATPDGGNQG